MAFAKPVDRLPTRIAVNKWSAVYASKVESQNFEFYTNFCVNCFQRVGDCCYLVMRFQRKLQKQNRPTPIRNQKLRLFYKQNRTSKKLFRTPIAVFVIVNSVEFNVQYSGWPLVRVRALTPQSHWVLLGKPTQNLIQFYVSCFTNNAIFYYS